MLTTGYWNVYLEYTIVTLRVTNDSYIASQIVRAVISGNVAYKNLGDTRAFPCQHVFM